MNPVNALPLLAALFAVPVPEFSLADRDRFPSVAVCAEARARSREYTAHLYSVPDGLRDAAWYGACADAEWCWQCWDWCYAAQGGEGRDAAYWLGSLEMLKGYLGDEAFWAGTMPPATPLWHYRELR